MTINQALDELLTKYKGKDLDKFPAVMALKCSLVELKVFWGGNTPVENKAQVKRIIKNGK